MDTPERFLHLDYIDGLVQERRNSSVLAMELRLSCTNPSIWYVKCNAEKFVASNYQAEYIR